MSDKANTLFVAAEQIARASHDAFVSGFGSCGKGPKSMAENGRVA